MGGKVLWVHRLAFALFRRSLPAGREVDHKCRVRNCCNPAHLKMTTRGANGAAANRRRRVACDAPF